MAARRCPDGVPGVTDLKNVDGHFYPPYHRGWGGFAEELFHYTSRYCFTVEVFLRNLSGDDSFSMSGYSAAMLSPRQRDLLAAVLSCGPDHGSAAAVMSIVRAVLRGEGDVDGTVASEYRACLQNLPKAETLAHKPHADAGVAAEVDPLDPFMSLAERLLMPVAVRGNHVEVSLHQLARHLQSPNSTLRGNLHNAVVDLHNAGFVLRNHPHLTHAEAQSIAGDPPR